MTRYIILQILIGFYLSNTTTFSQCSVTINASSTTVPCGGGNVTLTASGSGYSTTPLNNTFDAGNAGPGWNVSPAGQFNNPCDPSYNGGTYMWMGSSTAAPRTLETAPMDLSCGGTICFHLDFSTQGGASPCEGPDLANEGVYFEYSTNGGATWTTINYFAPNSGGTSGTITTWNQYCFPIPAGAQTTNTLLHWYQSGSSGTCCDHWGIDDVVVTATGCGSVWYDWSNIPGTVGPAGDPASQTVFVDSDTTFTVCFTDGAGFNCCESINITVLGMGIPNVVPVPETCLGDNDGQATVTPNGGVGPYTYNLTSGPSSPLSNGTGVFTGLTPGNYSVDVIDAGSGCTTSQTFTIAAGPNCCGMTISTAFTNPTCNSINAPCNGTITLGQAGGIGTINYSIDNGVSFQTNGNFSGLCQGTYNIVINDGNGCTETAVINITEPTAVNFTSATIATACGVSNGEITLSPSGGTGGYSYSFDGGLTYGISPTLTGIPAGNYSCCVRDLNLCTYCLNVTVSNSPAQSIDNIAIVDESCNGACDGSFTITTSGGTPVIQYSINGSPLQASNQFTGLCSGNYTILTEDAAGCQVFGNATISTPNSIAYTPVATDASCFGICDGTISFNSLLGGTPPYTYSIDNGITQQAGNTFTGLCAGTYDIVVFDQNNCQLANTIDINEPTAVQAVIANSTNVTCNGGSDGSLEAQTGGGTGAISVIWDDPSSQINLIATGLASGNYCVTATDQNGCQAVACGNITEPPLVTLDNTVVVDETCFGSCDGSIVLTASNATEYSIDNGISFQPSNTFSNLCSGTYNIIVQDNNGCQATGTTTVTTPTSVILSVGNDTTICNGGTANLTANAVGGTGIISYSWNNGVGTATQNVNPVSTTTYSVTASDASGCSTAPQSLTVTVNPLLTVLESSDISICNGENAGISAFASGGDGGPYNYTWTSSPAGTNLTGDFHTVQPSNTTIYTVTVSDGCETPPVSADVTITVFDLPDAGFVVNDPDGCTIHTATFTNTTSAALSGNCFWDFGDGSTSNFCDPTHSFVTPGCYDITLTVTSPNGCITTVTQNDFICVYEIPVSQFTFGPQPTSIVNSEIEFINNSIGATNYSWSFGDGSDTMSVFQTSHIYSTDTPGSYQVCLIAESINGCIDTSCNVVVIDDMFLIYVPNAFTPDNDGINDFFIPILNGYDIDTYELFIYDRWGEMIFNSLGVNSGWDGTYKGFEAKSDVYVWKIKVVDSVGNEKKQFIGHFTLLR
jgi:gliding motility-associated-like protein